jgi:hypothetical protein
MSNEKPLLYVILGATGSGRREVIADVIEAGLVVDASARAVVLLAQDEPASEQDARLGSLHRWRRDGEAIVADVPAEATHVFFLADGRANPVDQLEALKPWLAAAGLELARVICVVNCRLAEANPPLLTWYDACIHFSDMVLLHQRDGVANKWLSDFRARYEGKFYPCLIELVKGGRVSNPALLLEPQARRMSHYFEDEVDWVIDGEPVDEEDIEEGEEEVTGGPAVDPYLERRAGGRRVKEIPDIATFLQ